SRGARRTCPPTTATSSTPAAPRGCPRACSGGRPTSSPPASASTGRPRSWWLPHSGRGSGSSPPRRSCTVPPTGTRSAPGAAAAGSRLRLLAAPPCMHGAAHRFALRAWCGGGTVVVQDRPSRLDPDDILRTIAREQVTSLLVVGDAFARPLVDALRSGRHGAG